MYPTCIGVLDDIGCFHVQGCTEKTFSNHGGVNLLKAIIHEGDPESDGENNNNFPWCVCGHCRHMPLKMEKGCYRQGSALRERNSFSL